MAVMASEPPTLESVVVEPRPSAVQQPEAATNGDTNGHLDRPLASVETETPETPEKMTDVSTLNGKIQSEVVQAESIKTVGAPIEDVNTAAPPVVDDDAMNIDDVDPPVSTVPGFLIPETVLPPAPEPDMAEATSTVPPVIEQPTSDIRDEPVVSFVEETKHEEEAAPISAAETTVVETTTDAADEMDTSDDPVAPSPLQVEHPPIVETQTTNSDNTTQSQSQSQSQSDLPPTTSASVLTQPDDDVMEAVSSSGQVRPREDDEDDEDGPSAKRPKVEDDERSGLKAPDIPTAPYEASPAPPAAIPAPSTDAPAPSTDAPAPSTDTPALSTTTSAPPTAAPAPASDPAPTSDHAPAITSDATPDTPAASATPAVPVAATTAAPEAGAAPAQLPDATPASYDSNPITKGQSRYLLDALRKAKKVKAAQAYITPVDYVTLNIPTYPEIIKQPMDLSTMEDKIKKEAYATANDFMADFELIIQNSIRFNGSQHPVAQLGMNLKAYFVKLMAGLPKGDAANTIEVKKPKPPPPPPKTTLPRRESRAAAARSPTTNTNTNTNTNNNTNTNTNTNTNPNPTTTTTTTTTTTKTKDEHQSFLDSNGLPIIRRDSSTNDRPKREIIKPPPKDLIYSGVRPKKKKFQLELRFCENVVKELMKSKYRAFNWPFLNPVDPVALNIPNYHKIIRKPMDFGTIEKNLKAGVYNTAKEFHTDAKTVFQNCFKFNPPTDDVFKMGKQLEEAFDAQWEGKDQFMAENAPASEPASPASESDAEAEAESEEGEDDIKLRRMREIQEQIAALSAEAMNLTSVVPAGPAKRASPKAGSKKSKSSKATSSAPKAKRSSTGGAGKESTKASKAKAKPKWKKLSLEQKRYVSEAISQLDELNMRKAVQIIRNGVPSLRDVHDDELELDVDEIPDPVQYDLFVFVKRVRQAAGADVVEDDEYEESRALQKPATSGRKKNKPMSAREQESKIQEVREQLQRFQQGSGSERDGSHEVKEQDESSDDDASESSEEE